MQTITEALDSAARQIADSLDLNLRFGPDVDTVYLEDGETALVVLENELILGEVRCKSAHMTGYEVVNVSVAGTHVYSTTYYDDSRPARTELDLQFERIYRSSF